MWHGIGEITLITQIDPSDSRAGHRLMKRAVTSIVIELTGGYEKALVKALRKAQLPLEIEHKTS